MIVTPIFWGFLCDVLGRRKLLAYGLITDAFFNLMCASSRSFYAIVTFKFIGGLIMCGPFAVLMSYISELHGLQYRSVTMISLGIVYSFSDIILPVLSWIILPSGIHITLIEGVLGKGKFFLNQLWVLKTFPKFSQITKHGKYS